MVYDNTFSLLIGAIILLVILLDVMAISDLRHTVESKKLKQFFTFIIILIPFFGFSAYYIYKTISTWR